MNPKVREKERAIQLRKRGYTYNEILKVLPVAKSSLSLWLKDFPLTECEKQSLKKRVDKNISLGRIRAAAANRQNRLKKDRQPLCVRVRIHTDSLKFNLSTPGCGGRRGRGPEPQEQEIFDLWKKCGLTQLDFMGGQSVAFVKQLRRLL